MRFTDLVPLITLRHALYRLVTGLALAAGLAGLPMDISAAVQTNEHVVSYIVETNGAGKVKATFQLAPTGVVEVVPFAPDVIRVRFHFGSLYPREEIAIDKTYDEWPVFPASFEETSPTNLILETPALRATIVLSNRFQVHFQDLSGYDLLRDLQMEFDPAYQQIDDTNAYAQVVWPGESTGVSNAPSGFKLKAIKMIRPNEAFMGLGDLGGALNRRDKQVQFWTQDTYQFGEDRNPKYTALPMLYGLNGAETNHPAFVYGLFFHNPARPVFKMFSGFGDTWSFEAGDDQLDYFFFGGGTNHTMAGVVSRFAELTGRPAMLPKWALGYHQSRHSYFSQQRVLDLIEEFRTNDFPCDAIYLDIGVQDQISGQPVQFSFNNDYTNVPALSSHAATNGIRLIPLIEPLLTVSDPLYDEADSNLYFIKNRDLSTFAGSNFLGRISWLDFSITNAAGWWRGKVEDYIMSNAFEAVWNDLNEPNENAMPLDSLWYLDGVYGDFTTNDTRKWHAINRNTYSVWQASNSWRAIQNVYPEKRPFVLSRSAWPGIQKYAVGWSGDNRSTYGHLKFNIPMGLNVMLSGQALYGHDVGGFVGEPGPDLLTRWIQWGSLTPYFRNHTDNDALVDQEPWIYAGTYEEWNRRWIKYRYEIMPYLYTLMAESTTNGIPMNVPAAFYFYADTNTYFLNDYDFMVGRDLLAAPVYESNTVQRTVYLPFGAFWYFRGDGRRYNGGQTLTVPASAGDMPLFFRDGAIIPMGPPQPHVDAFTPDYLDIHHWPGDANSFTLYEDDGETIAYTTGAYARTRFSTVSSTNSLTLAVGAREGDYVPGPRAFYFMMHDARPVLDVRVDGLSIPRFANRAALEQFATNGWSYRLSSRQLIVRLPDDGTARTVTTSFQSDGDADGDGMPDWWELAFFTNEVAGLPGGDADGDGRLNLDEFLEQRNPLTPDAFISSYSNLAVAGTFNYWNEASRNLRLVGDHQWSGTFDLTGWTNIEFKFVADDSWALINWGDNAAGSTTAPLNDTGDVSGANIALTSIGTGPFTFRFHETTLVYQVDAAASFDDDGDTLPNDLEWTYGLDSRNSADAAYDLDADGLAFTNELAAGGSPLLADTDGDTVPDGDEFIAGTAVSNALDYFTVEIQPDGSPEIRWTAVSGRIYDLVGTTNLPAGAWSVIPPHTNLTGSGLTGVTGSAGAPYLLYRIDVRRE